MKRAVFLDRDGVIAEAVLQDGRARAPLTLEEYRHVNGVRDAVTRLRDAELLCIVFTNQPEIARGLVRADLVEEMHSRLRAAAPVHDIFVCPHERSEGCACCKPRPGMLLDAAKKWGVDLSRSFVVGDRGVDVEAGRAVGAYTLLIDRPYSDCSSADERVEDLQRAVDRILDRLKGGR